MPARSAGEFAGLAPYGSFAAADGDLIVGAGNDRLFAKLAEVLDRPDWKEDPRFSRNVARVANKALLDAEVHQVLATAPVAHWLALLETAGIPCAPIRTVPELVENAQVKALGRLDNPGNPAVVHLPMSFDGERPLPSGMTPRAGEHDALLGGGSLAAALERPVEDFPLSTGIPK